MYIGLHVKDPLFLSDFNETRIFSTDVPKNTDIPNFMKIRPVGVESSHAYRRTTDIMKLIVFFFRNFANSSKKKGNVTLKA